MRAAAVASCALLLAACGGAAKEQPREPRTEQTEAAAIDEAVALFLEMGEVLMSAADDCELMANAVDRWVDANRDRRARIDAALLRFQTPEATDAYRRRLSQHLDVVRAMQVAVEGCQEHAGFARAWSRLDD